jgi:dipeptidyl aminopeptidase/acylaminoacyl peptidase
MKISNTVAAALAVGLLAASAQGVQAAAKAPITHESLWMMKRVGAPAVSSDGKWVLFQVVEPAYEADKAVSDLWLVPAAGGAPPRRITNTKGGESEAVWSPDSRQIAFVAKREGDDQGQVYLLDIAQGGEARRVTSLSTGASHPQWRPDGAAILFESFVYPGAGDDAANRKAAADKKALKYNLRAYEHFPIRYWNEWLDERQPTILVQGLEPGAAPKDILAGTKLSTTPGFSGVQGETNVSLSPAWSPDGKEVVFVATVARWTAAYATVPYQIYRTSALGGEPTPAVAAKGDYADPAFSPDGKWLFFIHASQDGEVYNLPRLMKTPWPGGGAGVLVAKDFDREPNKYALTPDSKTVYLLVPEAGMENLYKVGAEGGKPALVIAPATGGYTNLAIPEKAAKTVLIASYGSAVTPVEIVRIDPAAKRHVNLTDIDTAAAAAIDWSPPQHFTFTSAKGRRIHSMLVTPPGFDPSKKYPMLVLIHGGPASTNPDQIGLRWNYHLLAAPGYVVLMTDYTGSTGYGETFAQAIKLDPLKGPGEEIDQAVDEALKRYAFIDSTRMCAGGASYGGHLTNWIEATTTRYKCLVSHAGEVDLTTQWGVSDGIYGRELTNGGPPWKGNPIWKDQSPITYAAQWKTPMLLSIGERDFRVPLANTLENWAVLQHQKVPSRLLVWPDAWHWITKPEDSRKFYQEVQGWLGHYLKGEGPGPAQP